MFSEALRDITKPQVLAVISALKTSSGLTVGELTKELDMSYMGVKQHCQKLETLGFLKTWRVPRDGASGRPKKLYLLTEKCHELFPQPGMELVENFLGGVKQYFGETSPEKLFYRHFDQIREEWNKSIKKGKSLVEKATRLADLRDKSGCFSRCKYDPNQGFRIEEYHHPLKPLFELYPGLVHQELRMMEQLLGCRVERTEVGVERDTKIVVYLIKTLV